MRICFLSQEDIVKPQGGTGTYVRNVSLTLAARGHDIHVIARQREDQPLTETVGGVTVHRVPAPGPAVLYSPLYFARSRRKFTELHTAAPFDRIQGNLPLMSSWGVQAPGLPPVVETVHCTVGEELKALAHTSVQQLNLNEVLTRLLAPVIRRRERVLLKRARRVVAVSRGLQRELVSQQTYAADKIIVIPNGIDYTRFAATTPAAGVAVREKLGIAADESVILYLGRLVERKRVIDLVRALPGVLNRVPAARLVIVGRQTPNAARIRMTAQELGVLPRVTFVDHVPYAEVPAYYALADVYALPSAYEGFPFTVLEAMAVGTPVVASNIPGIDEQIDSETTGLLHAVGDVGAIAAQISRVLSDPKLAAGMAKVAQHKVAQYYDWSVIGAQTEAVFAAASLA